MRAAVYDRFGPAAEVLQICTLEDTAPRAGEVAVRLHATGVNPSDVKLRAGARPGAVMAFDRVVPHSDGAGVIEAVGAGVDPARVGQPVWIWNGGWQRAHGTAATRIVLPQDQAVTLPDGIDMSVGACLGIPAMTAWYALYGDGADLGGRRVLVTGGAGTVGRYAVQMARLGGAQVVTTVSSQAKADHAGADHWIDYTRGDVAGQIMDLTDGQGVDRIVDVDFGANQATSCDVIREGGTIAAYASAADMAPVLQFYPLMFRNVTLRMLIAYLIPEAARRRGEAQLTQWLRDGALSHAVVDGGGLNDIAAAHDRVAAGDKLGTVVLRIERENP